MVGADKSTELRRHPILSVFLSFFLSLDLVSLLAFTSFNLSLPKVHVIKLSRKTLVVFSLFSKVLRMTDTSPELNIQRQSH